MTALALVAFLFIQQSTPPPPAKSPKPMGSFDDRGAGTSRPFQSVGVRGTIDAGGYAASASVKTQSEFFEQLTRTQVTVLRPAWAPSEPCTGANRTRRMAVELLNKGDAPAAVNVLENLLRTDKEKATRQLLGLAYEGSGQFGAAAEQFRIAEASSSETDEADFFARSAALLLDGDIEGAQKVSERAVARSAHAASIARLSLGAALFQHGDVSKALGIFLEVASATPAEDFPFGFIAAAVGPADPASLQHATDVLHSLARRAPQNASVPYALACTLTAAKGEASKVETQLKRALALDPQFADAHFQLGVAYAEREDLQEAIGEFRSALACNPQLADAHYRLGQLYARCGQPQFAKAQLESYQQLRAKQKAEIESGKVLFHFPGLRSQSCP